MSHQPIETWIFAREPLNPEQTQALQEHLAGCSHCRELAAAWKAIEPQLSRPALAAPAPGFTNRWQTRLAEERSMLQQRQAWLVLTLSVAAAGSFLLMVVTLVLFSFRSPLAWFLALVDRLAEVISLAAALLQAAGVVMEIVPAAWWASLGLLVGLLCAAWIISLQKFSPARRLL
jgi:anti-sigma factor RsiW